VNPRHTSAVYEGKEENAGEFDAFAGDVPGDAYHRLIVNRGDAESGELGGGHDVQGRETVVEVYMPTDEVYV
jgi:hypothetical protein